MIEYIAATEKLCQAIEQGGDNESVERAQQIRNTTLSHIKRGVRMNIKNNLSAELQKLLKDITSNTSIVICPSDKGKAIVIEDRESYY